MNRSLAATIRDANSTLIGSNDLEAIPRFFSPGYVAHVTGEDMALGHGGVKRILGLYRSAFPDLRVEVEILAEAQDRVAWQRTFHATHTGDFKGFPATGKELMWRDMVTSRVENGLIVEDWFITDLAERLLILRKGR